VRATILDQAVTWPWTTDEKKISDLGVIGDAQAASAEFGQRLLDRVAETAGIVFKQLLDRQHLVRG
jgi:creatinine amidohydrolase/Fe(II)-dependent formamide hydrolase-like protein